MGRDRRILAAEDQSEPPLLKRTQSRDMLRAAMRCIYQTRPAQIPG